MKVYLSIAGVSLLTALTLSCDAQQPDLIKRKLQVNRYRHSLQLDSAGAEQVAAIQNAYKKSLYEIVADTSIDEPAKRIKIASLIQIKNNKLRQLLSPAQQQLFIPSTERNITENKTQ